MERYSQAEIEAFAKCVKPHRLVDGGRLAGGLEWTQASLETADLSLAAITERWARSKSFLLQFIRNELCDDPALVELAEHALHDGRQGLELLGGHRDTTDAELPQVLAALEVVVQTDGSRPSYLIRNNAIVPDSSPPGEWIDILNQLVGEDKIRDAMASVGRIDIDSQTIPYAGTGWLVAPDVVITNRHVAQLFVDFAGQGGPRLKSELSPRIDFGHEFKGIDSVNIRPIVDLIFAGQKPILEQGINHSVLDLAAFRVGPSDSRASQTPLPIGFGPQLGNPRTQICVAGYPARPSLTALGPITETDRVLQLLFGKLWGYKRLAPGEIMPATLTSRTISHDATTLGGNSGSMVMGIDTAPAVTGLHYGGNWGSDRVNWAHLIKAIVDEPGLLGLRYDTFSALCRGEGVARGDD